MVTHVSGHALPDRFVALMQAGEWETLRDSPGFRALLEPYGTGADARLFDAKLMETETAGLIRPTHELIEKIFLGVPDEVESPGDIDPGKCVLFADLGHGSDQPLALDYRCDPPRVLILVYRGGLMGGHTRWAVLAEAFEAFCRWLKAPDRGVPGGSRQSTTSG